MAGRKSPWRKIKNPNYSQREGQGNGLRKRRSGLLTRQGVAPSPQGPEKKGRQEASMTNPERAMFYCKKCKASRPVKARDMRPGTQYGHDGVWGDIICVVLQS